MKKMFLMLLVVGFLFGCYGFSCHNGNGNGNGGGTDPVVSTVFTRNGNVLTLDMSTLPDSFRKAGWDLYDNAAWWAVGNIYYKGPGEALEDDSAGSIAKVNTLEVRTAIYNWFDAEVGKVRSMMVADPQLTLVAITNDERDRLGFRLGAAIVSKLSDLGGRVQLGNVYNY